MMNHYPVSPIIPSGRMALLTRSVDARALKSPAILLFAQIRELIENLFGVR